ncbi:MAG: hypothetical protein IMW94_04795 [Thermoanaerobacter sp.]|nr:hypothetical protein [Thermoanaerobacter sp.]
MSGKSPLREKKFEVVTVGLREKLLSIIGTEEPFDPTQAEALFTQALERVSRVPPEALSWARENKPELVEAIRKAEQAFQEVFQSRDMAGCRAAVLEYERVFQAVAQTYQGQRELTADEVIAAFDCDRTWNLTDEQVQVLDTVFASPLPVVEVAGKRWYSPEGWRDNHQPARPDTQAENTPRKEKPLPEGIRRKIAAIEQEAQALGWSHEELWGTSPWDIDERGFNHPGLAAILKTFPKAGIGRVTGDYIELLHGRAVHRFRRGGGQCPG